jgi:hypothetical protein
LITGNCAHPLEQDLMQGGCCDLIHRPAFETS